MSHALKFLDDGGPVNVSYQAMKDYHGKDFHGGVALAFKALQLAFEELCSPDEAPHRDKIRIILGFNPPGVVDAIEYATRALTRQRMIVDPGINKGPKSVFGSYYIEVRYGESGIALTLKDNLLPDDFTGLAQKALAKMATEEERRRWTDYKLVLGERIILMDPRDVFDIQARSQ